MTIATSHQHSSGSMKLAKAPRAGCSFLPLTCTHITDRRCRVRLQGTQNMTL